MAGNRELESGLKAIAEDFRLPNDGRMKLSKLVAGHLAWFDVAERRGMGWRDIIRALTAAGVTGLGGKPLSIGTLSSTVWRKRSEAAEGVDRRRTRPEPPQQVSSRQKSKPTGISVVQFRGEKHAVVRQRTDTAAPRKPASAQGKCLNSRSGAQSNKDVLASMDRARSVRRQSE